jgi:hypothetical protein
MGAVIPRTIERAARAWDRLTPAERAAVMYLGSTDSTPSRWPAWETLDTEARTRVLFGLRHVAAVGAAAAAAVSADGE